MASRRRVHWVFWLLGAIAVALALWAIFGHHGRKPTPPKTVPVTAAAAKTQDLPISLTALGAAQAWTSDQIFSQVSGKLIRVNFSEGANVRAGQILAEVDPAPYQAVLMQAEGALQRDQAILAGAQRDLARYALLNARDSIARQTYEDELATVKQDEGLVELDQGAVKSARVNLSWTRIVSPISGRAGVRLVDPGNLVSAGGSQSSVPSTAAATNASTAPTSVGGAGGSAIVTVNQIEPMAVTFTVPQGEFQRLLDLTSGFRTALPVKATSQDTGAPLGDGELRVADNHVDPSTGTVELKARFANPGDKLWPGQFINVVMTLQTLRNVITVPTTAINRGPNGTFVFIIGANHHVSMQPVKVSWTQGDLSVVSSGLTAGLTVVTDGQMTLKNGSLIRVVRMSEGGS
ncbi:MAG TPA: efflux RND transporter periplasmic adaptor subunit [Caulobacteraceae bacterium]|jgi:multidrug efflux system membrane fusion protein|nr:efflux RND transporter periplasmic adaptor subunit [Caulobacteraceae bacterium]